MKGSVYLNETTNKWYFMIDVGKDEKGKRKQKKKSGFKTREDALSSLYEYQGESLINDQIESVRDDISQIEQLPDLGFAGELIVQANLIIKGFTTFQTNKSNSEVDLIAMKNDYTYKIQVKTGVCKSNGILNMDIRKPNAKNGGYRKDSFDILAIVDIEKCRVAYFKWSEVFPKTKLTLRTSAYVKSPFDTYKNPIMFNDYLKFPEIY